MVYFIFHVKQYQINTYIKVKVGRNMKANKHLFTFYKFRLWKFDKIANYLNTLGTVRLRQQKFPNGGERSTPNFPDVKRNYL